MGGYHPDLGSLADDVEQLDINSGPRRTWRPLPVPLELFSAVLIDRKVVVTGGLSAEGYKAHDRIEWIELHTHTVTPSFSHLQVSRFGHEAVWVPQVKKLLIAGGAHLKRFTRPDGTPGTDSSPRSEPRPAVG